MTDTAWRIATWDRTRGRGTIECGGTQLEFDASIALVDDFEIGEGVHVNLVTQGTSFRVAKIWPDDPRVPDPGALGRPIPELDPATHARVAAALGVMPIYFDYWIESIANGDLTVLAGESRFEQKHLAVQRLVGVEYIDLPYSWDGKMFRLANAQERAYLASRCEVRRDTVAIKIVDEALRPYFVVCADFTFERVA